MVGLDEELERLFREALQDHHLLEEMIQNYRKAALRLPPSEFERAYHYVERIQQLERAKQTHER